MYDFDYIAVPIDFSRSSRAALSLAQDLADKRTHVQALHVVDAWPPFMEQVLFPYAPLGEDAAEIEDELRRAATDALGDYHQFADENGPIVAYGPLKKTLIDEISRTPSQLVVAGAFGEGGAVPDALGSCAQRIVAGAGSPVLLVRGVDTKPRVGRVLVALDLTEGSERVFEVAARLALRAEAELHTLHVVPDPLRDDQNKMMRSILRFDRRKVAAQARDRVEGLFDRMFRSIEPAFGDVAKVSELSRHRRVKMGDPATTIVDVAAEVGADVIVVGRQSPHRASSYLGRVASAVARRAPMHVCVAPLGATTVEDDDD